ncbi:MAG: Uma2 family endonuclease [Roseiflexus sp.]|jgi:Uma2 family endonuclease|nr:Uma2 family endonuclease [Roseiflexus sp.]MBO9333545.1 Uma2 family endonuclease [Roseiflexus sp.]MBO9363343.1 Uma2 family endonuclease [Roseiflexus sp.]MBO9380999.1 Uma2 family endonuclease [Roseiflexus sp.]MBO9387862.1 Uma2 family endonuclease [Roseiflexus sp.]
MLVSHHSTITTSQEELDALVCSAAPRQGQWHEEDYLWLSGHASALIEFTDGYIEVLPVPSDRHQSTLLFLCQPFLAANELQGGKVLVAPLRLRIHSGKYREPDLLLVRSARDTRRQEQFWTGANLVLEVVSHKKPERDLVEKRTDHAEGGIPEYWIINPLNETIMVLRLLGDARGEHETFGRGAQATSALLEGFAVSVDAVFDAE